MKIPTGFLLVKDYSKGPLETLSIGDYGKAKNVKAQFLGYNKDIETVPNGETEPLSEKWVITLSTQYGCPMKCRFCDCPQVGFNGNATFDDLKAQLYNALACFPDVKQAGRLNIHFARMGEPMLNFENVISFSVWLYESKPTIKNDTGVSVDVVHPVLTTMFPRQLNSISMALMLTRWALLKNDIYNGQAGLQVSINSTSESQRREMFGGMSYTLGEMSFILDGLPEPIGRKYCLNFALADGYETDAKKLSNLFDPDKFMVKITPIHNSCACRENGIETHKGYIDSSWYREAEASFIEAGFDVLVFVPSMDEENCLVTCGNAILSNAPLSRAVYERGE